MHLPLPSPTPPTEFLVVGEHREDPTRLLLLGADGHYYAYALDGGATTHVEVDEEWSVESPDPDVLLG
jgi:hypothetical protein